MKEGPCQLTNVLLFTIRMDTLKPIDHPTFLGDLILILGGHQEVPDGVTPLKCTWTPTLPQTFLKLSQIYDVHIDV